MRRIEHNSDGGRCEKNMALYGLLLKMILVYDSFF